VDEFVRHDRFLDDMRKPVGNEKRLLFRIVVPCCLLSEEIEHKFLEAKIWGEETPLHHRFPLRFPLRWRQRVLRQCQHRRTYLLAITHRPLDGSLRLQLPQAHDTLEHLIKGGQ
jgi:hypothetical protein